MKVFNSFLWLLSQIVSRYRNCFYQFLLVVCCQLLDKAYAFFRCFFMLTIWYLIRLLMITILNFELWWPCPFYLDFHGDFEDEVSNLTLYDEGLYLGCSYQYFVLILLCQSLSQMACRMQAC